MKTTVLFQPDSCTKEDISVLIERLKSGHEFKFVYSFRVNIFKEEFYMILSIAESYIEHDMIFAMIGEVLRYDPNRGYSLDIDPSQLGAGYLKMENNNLIFCDMSGHFGKYKKEYLSLGEDGIREIFGVDEVIFQ
ncbi:hypothetical protein ACFL2R_02095 [Patescibacteria group bacterium]